MEAAKSSSATDVLALGRMSGVISTLAIPPKLPTMKALELRAFDGISLVFVSNKPIPVPNPGEVLVRVCQAPITVQDVLFLQGLYGVQRSLPVVPGLECSGVVVQSGGGLLGRALVGRRVVCGPVERGDGTWAEYVCVPTWRCVPLRSFVPFDQGATLLSTGIAAYALLEAAKAKGAKALAHATADTPLCRMLAVLAERRGLPVLHLVERATDGAALRTLGAKHVVEMSADLSDGQLRALFAALGVSVVLESRPGERTQRMLRALPQGGSVVVTGQRGDGNLTIDPSDLVRDAKSIEGFRLVDWMRKAGFTRSLQAGLFTQKQWTVDIRGNLSGGARLPLDSYHQALDLLYRGRITDGQIQFTLI
ncbi:MAG TPA: zinc-binding dehydrogenase [Pseudomonadota bacterium]|jgi:NADPH:quinone reductase-like Zn-dependent oxidoreductase|nr:zinc-binding dehydrogenase [Pseudomonadota bacterium]